MDKICLVEQCKSGDRDAFGLLYQTYLPAMREVVAYYIHSSDIVWDILHDGFLIAFTSIGALNNGARVEAWLTTIMKNLSLQYIKDVASHMSVPLSEAAIADNAKDMAHEEHVLTLEELNAIIDKLPDGYGKVFRLAVLDGFSHKEIGALLGIAPHSSSSQLTRAKAMLRRMIVQYRVGGGILSLIGVILLLCYGIFKHREENTSIHMISKNTDGKPHIIADSIADGGVNPDSIIPKQKVVYKTINPQKHELVAGMTITKDSIPAARKDSVANDTIRRIQDVIDSGMPIAQEDLPHSQSNEAPDWSLSLAFSGGLGQNGFNRYRIHDPDISDVEGPDGEIEVTEKTYHHMPVVVGLSLSKSLSSQWSVETGLRYTLLRSEIHYESELTYKEINQRIHYIGVPLKFNYRMFTYGGFSLYCHGGGALDIPVNGSQSVCEYSPEEWGNPNTSTIHIQAPVQWSVEGGLGIQYDLTPSVSIYAEPSFRYYFNPGSDIKTIRQENSFEFIFPIGLRLTWDEM